MRSESTDLPNRRWTIYSFGHPAWSWILYQSYDVSYIMTILMVRMGTDLREYAHSWWFSSAAHWETRPSWPDISLSHIILTLSQPILALSYNAECLGMQWQVSIFKSPVWLNREPDLPHARPALYRFCHRAGSIILTLRFQLFFFKKIKIRIL